MQVNVYAAVAERPRHQDAILDTRVRFPPAAPCQSERLHAGNAE